MHRELLIPIGIGALSILGISLLFLFIHRFQPQATTPAPPTDTPFKFLLLATESRTPNPASESDAESPTEGVSALDQPSLSATESATPQVSTDDTTSAAPGAAGTPTFDPAVFYAGQYDDIDERIIYEGEWINEIVSGAYNETLFTSLTIGSTAAFTFVGEQVQLGYLEGPELGTAIIQIDEVEYALDQSVGVEWLSPEAPYAEHFVLITHASGDFIILDYITIFGSP
jgi:hypothetical protein